MDIRGIEDELFRLEAEHRRGRQLRENLERANKDLLAAKRRLHSALAVVKRETKELDALDARMDFGRLLETVTGKWDDHREKERRDTVKASLSRDRLRMEVTRLETRVTSLEGLVERSGLDDLQARLFHLAKQKAELLSAGHEGVQDLFDNNERALVVHTGMGALRDATHIARAAADALDDLAFELSKAARADNWDLDKDGVVTTSEKQQVIGGVRAAEHRARDLLRSLSDSAEDLEGVAIDLDVTEFDELAELVLDEFYLDWILEQKVEDAMNHVDQTASNLQSILQTLQAQFRDTMHEQGRLGSERRALVARAPSFWDSTP